MTTEWKPIASAPRDGSLIDLWVDGERLPDCFWFTPEGLDPWWHQKYAETSQACSFAVQGEPTYWMPRPEPPHA